MFPSFQQNNDLFQNMFGGFNFTNPKSFFDLDKKGRIKIDPLTGEKIDRKDRIKYKKFKKNPFGVTVGNAINPFLPEVPNFLSGVQGKMNPVSALLGGFDA